MSCVRCGSTASPVQGRCATCGTIASDGETTAAIGVATPVPMDSSPTAPTVAPEPGSTVADIAAGQTMLGGVKIGQNLGSRYHIIKLLGAGGMGAVYQAWDGVLEVAVALKVIRPESAPDQATAEALQRRFKSE